MRCWYCYRWMLRDNDATCTPWRCPWCGWRFWGKAEEAR